MCPDTFTTDIQVFYSKSRESKYSIGSIFNDIVIVLSGDRQQLPCGECNITHRDVDPYVVHLNLR